MLYFFLVFYLVSKNHERTMTNRLISIEIPYAWRSSLFLSLSRDVLRSKTRTRKILRWGIFSNSQAVSFPLGVNSSSSSARSRIVSFHRGEWITFECVVASYFTLSRSSSTSSITLVNWPEDLLPRDTYLVEKLLHIRCVQFCNEPPELRGEQKKRREYGRGR